MADRIQDLKIEVYEKELDRKQMELLKNNAKNPEEKVAGLVHCNNAERAEAVKAEILKTMKVKDVVILESSGVSTLYADQGGIILVL